MNPTTLIVIGVLNIIFGVLSIAASSIGLQCYNDESHDHADIEEKLKESNHMFLNYYVFGSVMQVLIGFGLIMMGIMQNNNRQQVRFR